MKKLLSSLIIAHSLCAADAQTISIPYNAATVTIDGVINASEWANAGKLFIPVSANDSVQVLYKHDFNAMYFAYSGKLETANMLFPEILVDPMHTRSSAWAPGQWWFHVSATDCENNGAYGVYSNCVAVQPGWEGVPNFVSGAPMTDTVEIKIPFSKLGINPYAQDTIGIVNMVTNTATIFKLWPASADRNKPSTWANATIAKWPTGIANTNTTQAIIYPNPAKDFITIPAKHEGALYIINTAGQTVIQKQLTGKEEKVSLAGIASGAYYLYIANKNGIVESQQLAIE